MRTPSIIIHERRPVTTFASVKPPRRATSGGERGELKQAINRTIK